MVFMREISFQGVLADAPCTDIRCQGLGAASHDAFLAPQLSAIGEAVVRLLL